MTDTDRELNLDEEDRLPWLEAVDNDDDEEGLSASKLLGFVIAALVALGLVIGGVWWLRSQQQGGGAGGQGELIAAAEGDYKIKPDEPGGMKVEGQGDAAFAASEGAEANGKIDLSARSETPLAPAKAPAAPAGAPAAPAKSAVSAAVPAPAKMPAPVAAVGGAGAVQLGAYGSQVEADQAWAKISGRHAMLANLSKSIVPAAVGGTTKYRLRVNAGSAAGAASLCQKLKAAGGDCFVP